jgi:CHAT domain-containing protein
MPKAQALQEAKHWLRSLTAREVEELVKKLPGRGRGTIDDLPRPAAAAPVRSFQHPYYWAGFILIGDPE